MIKNPSFSTGNRCGHDRHNPKSNLIYGISQKCPLILIKLSKSIERLNSDRDSLPPLRCAWKSNRYRRSERAESCTLVLKAIAKYIDLVTLKVGFFLHGKWQNLSYERIAKITGLSLSRVKRAMKDLQRVGLVGVHEIKETVIDSQGHSKVISRIAVKTVNIALFAFYGLEKMLIKERKKAASRFKTRQKQERQAKAEAHIPDCAKGLKGAAQARATMQAMKYQAKQVAKKLRKASCKPPESLEWDDGIPY